MPPPSYIDEQRRRGNPHGRPDMPGVSAGMMPSPADPRLIGPPVMAGDPNQRDPRLLGPPMAERGQGTFGELAMRERRPMEQMADPRRMQPMPLPGARPMPMPQFVQAVQHAQGQMYNPQIAQAAQHAQIQQMQGQMYNPQINSGGQQLPPGAGGWGSPGSNPQAWGGDYGSGGNWGGNVPQSFAPNVMALQQQLQQPKPSGGTAAPRQLPQYGGTFGALARRGA